MLAVKHGKTDLVELLLSHGATVNTQDFEGATALMYAVDHGSLNIVKMLLARPECDVDIVDHVRFPRGRSIDRRNCRRFVSEWSNSC